MNRPENEICLSVCVLLITKIKLEKHFFFHFFANGNQIKKQHKKGEKD